MRGGGSELTAIVLAAGVGSRLRPLTDSIPKCLVSLGRETLLGRMVRLLAEAGAARLVVSTGYRAEAIHRALEGAPLPVTFVHNPDHATTQNVVSLHRALSVVEGGSVVKLDGDVVFPLEVLSRVLAGERDGVVAVDDRAAPRAEAMKVMAEQGLATRFGKGLTPSLCAGESIGIERFDPTAREALARVIARAVKQGRTDAYYEDVYNDLLEEGWRMECVSVGDLAWTEVDDLEDLSRARALFPEG